jgi:hypothetical protein
VPDQYGTHDDYRLRAADAAKERRGVLEGVVRQAFAGHIVQRQAEAISFDGLSPQELGKLLRQHPDMLKPLLYAINVGSRVLKRDLNIRNANTYKPKLSEPESVAVAELILKYMPPTMDVESFLYLDRIAYVDRLMRMSKGQWEKLVVRSLAQNSGKPFRKRRFADNRFELDAAIPNLGPVECGIDVKRVEAVQDHQKRIDEITSKAAKLREVHPEAKFGVVVYYPFDQLHPDFLARVEGLGVRADHVAFAAEDDESIDSAIRILLPVLGYEVVAPELSSGNDLLPGGQPPLP